MTHMLKTLKINKRSRTYFPRRYRRGISSYTPDFFYCWFSLSTLRRSLPRHHYSVSVGSTVYSSTPLRVTETIARKAAAGLSVTAAFVSFYFWLQNVFAGARRGESGW